MINNLKRKYPKDWSSQQSERMKKRWKEDKYFRNKMILFKTDEWKNKISKSLKGKKLSLETRKKMSESRKGKPTKKRGRHYLNNQGENHPNWKGGKYVRNTINRLLRKERERNVGGSHSSGEWENLKAQYNWTCPCCKKREPEIKLTKDHIVAILNGGSNNICNIQPLCKRCNSKKHTKEIKYVYTTHK